MSYTWLMKYLSNLPRIYLMKFFNRVKIPLYQTMPKISTTMLQIAWWFLNWSSLSASQSWAQTLRLCSVHVLDLGANRCIALVASLGRNVDKVVLAMDVRTENSSQEEWAMFLAQPLNSHYPPSVSASDCLFPYISKFVDDIKPLSAPILYNHL